MDKVKISLALGAFLWAIIISCVALFMPPEGEISASVLLLIAQLLVLVSSLVGFNFPLIMNNNADKSNSKMVKA